MKIVSLLPAATEIVCALGLRESLAGRSHECDFPEDVLALPALTTARIDSSLESSRIDEEVRRLMRAGLAFYALDEARLASLAPDVVVTQAACEVCAISYGQVAASLRGSAPGARIVSLQPTRLVDVLADIRAVAAACGAAGRGEALVAGLERRLAAVSRSPGPRPRVAVIEWLGPPMLAGHWVPDAIQAAGGMPVGPRPGAPSAYATWDEVRALGADAAVVAPCGFDLARTVREAAPVADELGSLASRVLLLDGNAYLNRPGPRLVEAIETIADWLARRPIPAERGLTLAEAVPSTA
jgi:iron complex transport system substrate-binding protein